MQSTVGRREQKAWEKCQEAFRRNKAESKTWQEYNRMNRESYAAYEAELAQEAP